MALLDYLRARRDEIEGTMKALKAELAEIRVAEAALTGEPPVRRSVGGNILRLGTIKDWTMKALEGFPDGLETEAVIEAVRHMGGPLVERSSITPQLSRLKAAGLIMQEGRLWRLPTANEMELNRYMNEERPRSPNDETPGVSPPDVPEAEDHDSLG